MLGTPAECPQLLPLSACLGALSVRASTLGGAPLRCQGSDPKHRNSCRTPGENSRPKLMARTLGTYSWPKLLAQTVGPNCWPKLLAQTVGREHAQAPECPGKCSGGNAQGECPRKCPGECLGKLRRAMVRLIAKRFSSARSHSSFLRFSHQSKPRTVVQRHRLKRACL